MNKHTPGPWTAESSVHKDEADNGLAVIAVISEIERSGLETPTRGIVAWFHSNIGACATDEQAIATARLIAAAPELLEALKFALVIIGDRDSHGSQVIAAAIAKAEGSAP